MKKKLLVIFLCFAMVLLPLAACTSDSGEKMHVTYADAGWDSIKFHNAVAMYIGEVAYNIEGEEISGATTITYGALLSGELDVYMEIWTDNMNTYVDDLAEGTIHELGVNFDDNVQGFYVPRYVIEGDAERGIEPMAPDLVTVADLAKYPDVFPDPDENSKGAIYGAISGWLVDEIMRNKYEYYGLDEMFNYIDPGSQAAMEATIVAAIEKGEAWVGYYWEPTWISAKYDLVVLEDAPYVDEESFQAGKTAFRSTSVTVAVSDDFYKEAPEYCEFLSNYHTSNALTNEGLGYIQNNEGATYEDAAKWFLGEHDELLDEWLPADKAAMVREALAE